MRNKPTINHKQSGFTLLELVVVILIISILGLFAIDRVLAIRASAERSAVKQLVGTIKSALGLEVARLALEGKLAAVAKLNKSNPIKLLSQKPNNYIGEKKGSKNIKQAGIWYFDENQKALIYHINYNENFSSPLKGIPRIRYRIKLVYNDRNKNKRFDVHSDGIAGLDLVTIEKFSWSIQEMSNKNN